MTATIMHATWRRQAPRRIKYQPAEIKIVLRRLSEALIAGKSLIVMSSGVETSRGIS